MTAGSSSRVEPGFRNGVRPEPPSALSVEDYERIGRAMLSQPLADYVAGGSGEEWTLRENRAALRRWSLCPRVMTATASVDTSVAVLGTRLSMPLLVAPLAFLGLAAAAGEIATARAAAAQGTVTCLATFATVSPAELAAEVPGARFWFQLYLLRDRGATLALAERAAEAGARALVVTVDAPRIGRRERDLRSGFSIPASTPMPSLEPLLGERHELSAAEMFDLVDPAPGWERIEEICAFVDLPVLVKGVLCAADSRAALEHGAAGLIVSNHGGRQLDGARASVDALPEVVQALGGRAPVLIDGGLRRGADFVKALALGADAVLLGRPAFWALAGGGEDGVRDLLALLRDELELALALMGCAHPRELGAEHLRAVP